MSKIINIKGLLERFKNRNFLLVFLLIYCSQDALLFGTNANKIFFIVKNIILVFVFFFLVRKTTKNIEIDIGKSNIVLYGLISMSLLTSLLNFDITFKYLYEILLILIAYNITRNLSFDKFKEYFVYSLYYLSLLSVILYAISLFSYSLIELMPSFKNESGYIYYSFLGLCNVSEVPMYGMMRNASLFREPGVYAIFLIISLVFLYNTNTIHKRQRNKIMFVSSIAILTTLSTAGYIGLLLLIGYLVLGKSNQIGFGSKLFVILLCIVGVYYVLTNDSLYSSVFDKMSGGNDSANSRFGAIFNNIEMWSKDGVSILFGNGYQYVENNISLVATEKEYISTHNTNTLFKMLSVHGFFYFITIISLLYAASRKITSNHFSLYVMLLFCIMLSNEDLIFNQIIYIILFYGFSTKNTYNENTIFGNIVSA